MSSTSATRTVELPIGVVDSGRQRSTAAADGTEVEVAVRPSMVHLDGAGHDGATATAMTMIVTSALYERDGYSVSLRAGDHEFRAFAPGSARPEIDTAAVVRIDPPLVFASTPKEQE